MVRRRFELVVPLLRLENMLHATELRDACKADHGYNIESPAVQKLFQVMSGFTRQQQRDFLTFVTGSPNLPVGGG